MSYESEFDQTATDIGLPQVHVRGDVDRDEKRRMRSEYGYIRTYFKLNPGPYQGLQRTLNQARFGVTYDEYLAKSAFYALVIGLVGGLLGVLFTWQLAELGVLSQLRNPLDVRGGVVKWIAANRALFAGGVITLVLGGLLAAGTWAGRYYYPAVVVSSRRQNIDVVLPHAIVYMYALSHGGMDLLEVMKSLARSEETYGEVANEFEMIVNDIELFGSDMYSALQNARNLTPSENLEQFLDDMLSVLDAGGDVTVFFEEESNTYLREAKEEQETFLETLSLLAEVFVTGFVAAPLFLIVTLVVISLIGGNTVGQITILVYGVIPVAMLAFVIVIDVLGQPYEQGEAVVIETDDELFDEAAPDGDDPRFGPYRNRQRKLAVLAFLRDPLAGVRATPLVSLVLTVPLAVLLVAGLVAGGVVEPSLDALRERPVETTTALLVAPFLLVAVPLSVFYELKRRREMEISRRFPDTLNILSSANKMGIPLTEALGLVSRWSEGLVARELRTVRNDIVWNHDTNAALIAFGNRLRAPQLSRTMKLLADGIRSSGDLSRVLSIAAEDTRNREKLERARRRELSSYIAVVIIGFLVYLLVIVLLDVSYLQPISEVELGSETASGREVPLSFQNVPVATYQMMFFHSALIMAVGTGLLAGKLSDNEALSGLKYAIGLVAITLAVFLFV